MEIDTPEGTLTLHDDALLFQPADGGQDIHVGLEPVPDYRYERGLYGVGTLVIGDATIILRNDQASSVVEELRRQRKPKVPAGKGRAGPDNRDAPVTLADGDTASAK